jgi:hypothetical protein
VKEAVQEAPSAVKEVVQEAPPAVKEATQGEKHKLCGKTFTQEVFSILHSSPVEEKKFSPFSILNLRRMGLRLSRRACHIPIL